MENRPKISVIVPVYNVERYLHRCIDSILAQTFTDFELLLIDDGSKDQSGKICDEYAVNDKRVRAFHKENGGVSSARQIGIDNALGEYSIHVDGDDWIEQYMLEHMYEKITGADSDMLITDFFSDTETKSIYVQQLTRETSSKGILKDILCGSLFGSLWHKMIRHSLFKKYDVHFIPKIDYCEDVLVLAQLLQFNIRVTFLHEAFYHYNKQNQNSITTHYTRKTFLTRQKYVLALSKIIPEENELINNVAFQVKREAFIHNVLKKKEFYNFYHSTLKVVISGNYGMRLKLCMLLAYMGLFYVAKVLWKLLGGTL